MGTHKDSDHRSQIGEVDAAPIGPSVLRLLLGTRLRRLREAAGVTLEQAGYEIRASTSKISRMELGRCGFKPRDVADLLRRYGVDDEAEHRTVQEVARQASATAWWQPYCDVVPEGFGEYLDMEQAAALIRVYGSQQIPEMLQTPDYASAHIAGTHPEGSSLDNERRLEVRMRRQALLRRADGPRLWVILDEAALRRPVGGPAVMRRQLQHLMEQAEAPRLTLQSLPLSASGHACNGAPVVLLRFREDELGEVVYLQQLTGGQFLTKRADFNRYWSALNALAVEAHPPAATTTFLRTVLHQT